MFGVSSGASFAVKFPATMAIQGLVSGELAGAARHEQAMKSLGAAHALLLSMPALPPSLRHITTLWRCPCCCRGEPAMGVQVCCLPACPPTCMPACCIQFSIGPCSQAVCQPASDATRGPSHVTCKPPSHGRWGVTNGKGKLLVPFPPTAYVWMERDAQVGRFGRHKPARTRLGCLHGATGGQHPGLHAPELQRSTSCLPLPPALITLLPA